LIMVVNLALYIFIFDRNVWCITLYSKLSFSQIMRGVLNLPESKCTKNCWILYKIVILHELRQKSVNISTLSRWILDQISVLETSIDSTQILATLNDDGMPKSWSWKPLKLTEGENFMNWFTKWLAKNLNFSNLWPICMFLCKIWLNQRETAEKLIRAFHPSRIFNDLVGSHRLAQSFFKWKFACFLHIWA
jgi:hypothetical protein